jgi:uncharacterized protein YhbP (UPF0306 family)
MDSFEQTVTFLRDHHLGVLSTVSPQQEAWGAAIYFTIDETLNFYFLTHVDTDKYRNIKNHPQAAITVFDDDSQTTVQSSGSISEVPLGDENNDAYRRLAEIHPPDAMHWTPPISKTENGEIILMKLTPAIVKYANFTEPVKIETVIPRPAF